MRPVCSGAMYGKRARDELGWFGRLPLAVESRRDAEAGQPDLAGCGVDQHMRGFDVLVDEASPVHLANGGRESRRRAAGRVRAPSAFPAADPEAHRQDLQAGACSDLGVVSGREAERPTLGLAPPSENSCSIRLKVSGEGGSKVGVKTRTEHRLPSVWRLRRAR